MKNKKLPAGAFLLSGDKTNGAAFDIGLYRVALRRVSFRRLWLWQIIRLSRHALPHVFKIIKFHSFHRYIIRAA